MAKRPTVYDVAAKAGVSIATVSFAFRQPGRVRESTRATVLAAARELGYVPSASARGLAENRTHALGLYSFDMLLEADGTLGGRPVREDPGPFFGRPDDAAARAFADDADREGFGVFPLYVDEVQRGFELECARRGRALLIGKGPRQDGAGVIDIVSRVDGLAVFPGAQSAEFLRRLARRLPVVAFAMPWGSGEVHHIRADNAGGAAALTEHLVTVHGLRRIAFVGAPEMPDYAERFAGMCAALTALGVPAPSDVLDPTPLAAADPFPVLRDLLDGDRQALPEALVCASDQHALDVLRLLAGAGVRVPQDVAVTGFDGVVAGRLSSPSLTTCRQPMEAMGRLAVDVLTASIEDPELPPTEVTLPVRPLFRQSCGCDG